MQQLPTFELSMVRNELPFKAEQIVITHLNWLVKYPERYIIDWEVWLPSLNMNLQRPFCWTLEQKQELILSILKGIKIPALSIIHYKPKPGDPGGQTTYKIIDGKQRLSTTIAYVNNEFPLVLNDGTIIFFDQLASDAKNAIGGFSFDVYRAYEYDYQPISDQAKIDWFEQINFAGTPQDYSHITNLKNQIK